MTVDTPDGDQNLAERLIAYGFTSEYSYLIDILCDKRVITVEDVWRITGEYWKIRRLRITD